MISVYLGRSTYKIARHLLWSSRRRAVSAARGIGAVGLDPERRDRVLEPRRFDRAAPVELGEGRDADALGIDLEEAPQRLAGLAPSEAVGAERAETRRHEGRDLIGHALQIVRRGDDRPRLVRERARQPRDDRRLARVQPVPAV